MRYSEIESLLSNAELEAILELESCGWEILTETKLEDTHRKDGGRVRTFALSGRYDLAVVLKKIESGEVVESGPVQPPPDDSPDMGNPDDAEDMGISTGEQSFDESGDLSNFWDDRSKWIRMSRKAFCELVTEEALGDLKASTVELQAEVKEKFDRLCDPDDWPL